MNKKQPTIKSLIKKQERLNRTIAKRACERLDKLLVAIFEARQRRQQGHNDWEKIIQKEYSKSELFLDNIDWQSL